MPYQKNVHHAAVKHEEQLTADFKKDKQLAAKIINAALGESYQVEHVGGTTHKEDIKILDGSKEYLISVKKKEGTENGSFDWINSTKPNKNKAFDPIKALYKDVRNKYFHQKSSKKEVRSLLNEASNKILCEMTSDQVWDVLEENVILPYITKDLLILISDVKENKKYCAKMRDSKLYQHYVNKTPITLVAPKDAKQSRQIMFGNDNIGLRIRVTPNNGVGALLGLSKSNSNSSVSIKIQQDSVATSFLKTTKNVRIV